MTIHLLESTYPHRLSGGMRQRVGLAPALTVNADLILMDEPFSSVDEQTRRKFQEELLDLLRHKKKTVILVTHSIEEAVYLSDGRSSIAAARVPLGADLTEKQKVRNPNPLMDDSILYGRTFGSDF